MGETMNKRGNVDVSGYSIAALVFFLIFFVLYAPSFADTYSVLFGEENKQVAAIEFYNRLIDELNNPEITHSELLFTTDEDYVLVGFGKNQDSFSGSCGGAYFSKLKKPAKCEGKGCICLCNSKVIGREMCNDEEDICTSFEQDVKDSKSDCGLFVVSVQRIANLDVKKDANNIDINVLSSNLLR